MEKRGMAQLAREEKDAISHRGRAFAALALAIRRLLGGGSGTEREG